MAKRKPKSNPVEFVQEVIFRAEHRMEEILKTLGDELMEEFLRLEKTVQTLRVTALDLESELNWDDNLEEYRGAKKAGKEAEFPTQSPRFQRVPMGIQKAK